MVNGLLVIAGIGNCCPVSAKSPAAGGSVYAPADPVTHMPGAFGVISFVSVPLIVVDEGSRSPCKWKRDTIPDSVSNPLVSAISSSSMPILSCVRCGTSTCATDDGSNGVVSAALGLVPSDSGEPRAAAVIPHTDATLATVSPAPVV